MKTAFLIFGYSLAFALAVWVWGNEVEIRQLNATRQADAELIADYGQVIDDLNNAIDVNVSNVLAIVNQKKGEIMLINKTNCRRALLGYADRRWPNRMKSVQSAVYDYLDTCLRTNILKFVNQHPSIGKTLMVASVPRIKIMPENP